MLMQSNPCPFDFGVRAEALGEGDRLRLVTPLSKNEVNVERLVRSQLEVDLKRRAWVGPCIGGARQPPATERLGPRIAPTATQELGAIEGETVRRAVGGDEGDALSEIGIPSASRQQ